MTWRRRYARLRAKLRAALRGWNNPVGEHRFPVQKRAEWSREINFTSDQSVLCVLLPVNNELFRASGTPEFVSNIVVNEVANATRCATRRYFSENFA